MNGSFHCRFCAAPLVLSFADLGVTPLANRYLEEADLGRDEPMYPLHARVCHNCFLVQIPEQATPEELFGDYAYYSSYSSSWLDHSKRLAEEAIGRFALAADSLVVEVASNDGYLLRYFQEAGVPVLGIEPARNVARDAIAAGIPTEARFFGSEFAMELIERGVRADVLIGINVLAHVPDLNDFVAGLATLLKPTGTLVVEFPSLVNLIAGVQFDTIYHEHFSYLSLLAVEQILDKQGLGVVDVEQLPTHGGSLRVYATVHGGPASVAVAELRKLETQAGLRDLTTYSNFAESVEVAKASLRSFLDQARRDGHDVAAYGAAAKGNTLLNTVGVTTEDIGYVVDRSPHKQGRYLPGSHIPIYEPRKILETKPDYVLILPWNLKDEIVSEMSAVSSWGGRFVVPIPETVVLP